MTTDVGEDCIRRNFKPSLASHLNGQSCAHGLRFFSVTARNLQGTDEEQVSHSDLTHATVRGYWLPGSDSVTCHFFAEDELAHVPRHTHDHAFDRVQRIVPVAAVKTGVGNVLRLQAEIERRVVVHKVRLSDSGLN